LARKLQATQKNQERHGRGHNANQYFLSQKREVLQSHRFPLSRHSSSAGG